MRPSSPFAALFVLLLPALCAAGPLDPPKGAFKIEADAPVAGKEWTETVLRFPSPVKSPWPANDVVWAHLVVPRSAEGRRAPAVLVLPVMAAPNVWIENRFVERFAREGFTVMWLEMPTQFHRRPLPSEPSGQVFLARTPKHLAANFRQSVLDARRALGVLAARPEADPERIALFGISLGAIVGSVVYSVDPRPRYAAFLLGGADFPTLLVGSSLTGPFARKMGLNLDDLRRAWEGLDPVAYREQNRDKPVLLVNAWSDTVIPWANAEKLAGAFPSAERVSVPFGHYTAILHMFWMPRWVAARLQAGLGRHGLGKKTIKEGMKP